MGKNINVTENNTNYRAIIGNDDNLLKCPTDIIVSNDRELEILSLCLGEKLATPFVIEQSEWDYKKPDEAYRVIEKIHMPDYIEELLVKDTEPIEKKFVHKRNQNNVLISFPRRLANVLYFKGYMNSEEIISDHNADHLDGIKIFEVVRQVTLASFHVMGVTFNGVVALTTSLLHFNKFVELDKPYFIQAIPACKKDGGAMYCSFNVIQDNKSHAAGYLGAYTYRSKEAYENKRNKKI